jgi:hypothetical protein
MRLPKHENWTPATTERVKVRCWKLFERYEKCSHLDVYGNETSEIAKRAEMEGLSLQDLISESEWPHHERPF